MTTNAILLFGLILVLTMSIGAYLVFGREMRLERVGPAMFGIIGIASLGLGSVFFWDSYRFVQEAASAVGTVVGFDSEGGPLVEFETAQGERVEFKGLASNPPAFDKGDSVEVFYPKSVPQDARIKAFAQLWLQGTVFYGIGLAFTGIGLFNKRLSGRNKETVR